MKDEVITIAVHAKLAVDLETAVGCLWMVETFLNANCDYRIEATRKPDGTMRYQLAQDAAQEAGDLAADPCCTQLQANTPTIVPRPSNC
ncbi:MAG: hypothetical protein LUF28_03270 [Clostridiales bacterium]|nr:hypothetical protein [Clostridiales bacterium]